MFMLFKQLCKNTLKYKYMHNYNYALVKIFTQTVSVK